MTTTLPLLPQYEKPPINEVVFSILFKPIENLLTPHIGLLWSKYQLQYPYCDEVAPLSPTLEIFDNNKVEAIYELTDVPPLPRVWFINASGNGVIQIQRDRFIFNWRKVRPEDEYPKYSNIIKLFSSHLSDFENFLEQLDIDIIIQPLQYELTYVNHIPKENGWRVLSDLGRIFPDFAWQSGEKRFLPDYSSINWRTTFTLPNQTGRLHVVIRSALREDDYPIISFELTVRGTEEQSSREAMWSWFDTAHEWIVRSFADLTSEEVQKNVWKRRS